MRYLNEVKLEPLAPERFESVLTPSQYERFREAIVDARSRFRGVTIWNVNSTAYGGGVAEMLRSLVAYILGAGVQTRWIVVSGHPRFFVVTKRIHNYLHGSRGDGGQLDEGARHEYEATLAPRAEELCQIVQPRDFVVLHDPQTAGLVPVLKDLGVHVIWRCHVGVDRPNDLVREAWRFLMPYVLQADVCVFSRRRFTWEGMPEEKVAIIPPSLDAFAPKNVDLDDAKVASILAAAGIFEANGAGATFYRHDGSEAPVRHRAEMIEQVPLPADVPLVTQVSRWDHLKDPIGVMTGFVEHVSTDAHLILAGPAVDGVSDDPEGSQVLKECAEAWEKLTERQRCRVHRALLPMVDNDENAAMVNAIQRRSAVIVQKSLAEGFGLTVAEAMWKGRPVVASRVGGIQEQIEDGRTGLLLDDPRDLAGFGARVTDLLEHPEEARSMGARARDVVRERFLGPENLIRYGELLSRLPSR